MSLCSIRSCPRRLDQRGSPRSARSSPHDPASPIHSMGLTGSTMRWCLSSRYPQTGPWTSRTPSRSSGGWHHTAATLRIRYLTSRSGTAATGRPCNALPMPRERSFRSRLNSQMRCGSCREHRIRPTGLGPTDSTWVRPAHRRHLRGSVPVVRLLSGWLVVRYTTPRRSRPFRAASPLAGTIRDRNGMPTSSSRCRLGRPIGSRRVVQVCPRDHDRAPVPTLWSRCGAPLLIDDLELPDQSSSAIPFPVTLVVESSNNDVGSDVDESSERFDVGRGRQAC